MKETEKFKEYGFVEFCMDFIRTAALIFTLWIAFKYF